MKTTTYNLTEGNRPSIDSLNGEFILEYIENLEDTQTLDFLCQLVNRRNKKIFEERGIGK